MVELEIKWCIIIGLKLLVNVQRKGPSTELLENSDFKSPHVITIYQYYIWCDTFECMVTCVN